MKFKFIYLAFFTSLLFLFANGRDTNQKAAENYHNNDYEVHFVVHKTKKPKKENFLERKMKRMQKKVKGLVEKHAQIKKNKKILLTFAGIFLGIFLLEGILMSGIGLNSVVNAFFGGGILLFIFLCLIIFAITSRSVKKTQKQKG